MSSHKLRFNWEFCNCSATSFLKAAPCSIGCGKPNARLRLQLQETMCFYLMLTMKLLFTHCWNKGCRKNRVFLFNWKSTQVPVNSCWQDWLTGCAMLKRTRTEVVSNSTRDCHKQPWKRQAKTLHSVVKGIEN